jgi:hypothetical protein
LITRWSELKRPVQLSTSVRLGDLVFGQQLAALAGPVGVAGEGEDLGVVDEAVDHGGRLSDYAHRGVHHV